MKENLDFDNPAGRLVFHVFGALAEFERDTIKMRTDEGKHASALAGNFIGGQAPYGYVKVKNPSGRGSKLRVVEKEAAYVRQIFDWYVKEDLSYTEICDRLNSWGIRKGRSARSNSRHTPWHDTSVRKILRNEIYIGAYITDRYIKRNGRIIEERPRSEWKITRFEPIVSQLAFSQAQSKHKMVNKRYRGGGKETYMLSRKVVDPLTNKTFVGYLSGKKTKNYRRKKLTLDGRTYRTMSIAARGLESFVWNHVEKALSTPERFIIEHREQARLFSRRAGLEEKLALLSTAACEAQLRCDRVERDFYDGLIDTQKRDQLLAQFEPEHRVALNEQRAAEQELQMLGNYEQGCEDLRSAAKRFKARLASLTYEEKAKVCALFVERVEVIDKNDARVATAFLRFDPTCGIEASSEGRTRNPQPDAQTELSEPKSGVGGEFCRTGYQSIDNTTFCFKSSQTISGYNSM